MDTGQLRHRVVSVFGEHASEEVGGALATGVDGVELAVLTSVDEGIDDPAFRFVCEPKIDGLAVSPE